MEEADPPFLVIAKIVWAITWRSTLLTLLVGGPVGFVAAGIALAFGYNDNANLVGNIACGIASIPMYMSAIAMVIGKQFGGYTLSLTKNTTSASA